MGVVLWHGWASGGAVASEVTGGYDGSRFPYTWHPLGKGEVLIDHNCEMPSQYRPVGQFGFSVKVEGNALAIRCSDCTKVIKNQLPRY